ncbi:MAG: hypothetical protein MUO24_02270 [Desulfobacterales bacterium]|nr:hypothetical protein [Desulfobacterales bacterium]
MTILCPSCNSPNVSADEVFCSWEDHIPKEDRPRHFRGYCREIECRIQFVHDWYPAKERR